MIDFPTKPQLYFSRSRVAARQMNPGTILICAPDDRWNDFGHQTIFDYSVVVAPGEFLWRRFRLSFLNPQREERSEYEIVNDIFAQRSSEILSADNFPNFFSLQHSADSYRELANELGEKAARIILVALNDIVIAEHSEIQPSWLEEVLKSSAFNFSFIRTTDGFSSYFEGYNGFIGRKSQFSFNLPKRLDFGFKLNGFFNHHQFRFFFDNRSLLPKNMVVIIGKNGVGKSRTLNELVHATVKRTMNLTDENGTPPLFTKVIAVSTPGETASTFPYEIDSIHGVQYLRLSTIPGRGMSGTNETLPVLLQKLSRLDNKENSYRLEIFERAVSFVIRIDELMIVPSAPITDRQQYSYNNDSVVRLIDLGSSKEAISLDAARKLDRNGILVRHVLGEYYPLSSGQLSFIRLAAQLCLHVSAGTLVLIDEPETHLHPQLITQFVSMLNEILSQTNSIAVVATHSAYFVREVPTKQVQVISQLPDGTVQVGPPRLKTFGSDVGAISDFIFEDDAVSGLVKLSAARIRENEYFSKNWEKELSDELSTEAIMYIKRAQKKRISGEK